MSRKPSPIRALANGKKAAPRSLERELCEPHGWLADAADATDVPQVRGRDRRRRQTRRPLCVPWWSLCHALRPGIGGRVRFDLAEKTGFQISRAAPGAFGNEPILLACNVKRLMGCVADNFLIRPTWSFLNLVRKTFLTLLRTPEPSSRRRKRFGAKLRAFTREPPLRPRP